MAEAGGVGVKLSRQGVHLCKIEYKVETGARGQGGCLKQLV